MFKTNPGRLTALLVKTFQTFAKKAAFQSRRSASRLERFDMYPRTLGAREWDAPGKWLDTMKQRFER
jgi:hypothetical protein